MSDVFLSYAWRDDKAPSGEVGWVALLEERLGIRLNELAKRTFDIWKDRRDQERDVPLPEILTRAIEARALVCVLSEPYLASKWCEKEREAFVAARGRPIFKVIKLPVDRATEPAALRELVGYEFYREENKTPLELHPARDGASYYQQLTKLAHDISRRLLNNDPDEDRARPAVFLGATPKDLSEARERLRSEAHDRGFRIVSLSSASRPVDEVKADLRRLIGESALSIHFAGNARPESPEGSAESLLQLECAIAVELVQGNRRPLIWVPRGTKPEEATQRVFLDSLRTNGGPLELLEGDLEELRAAMLDRFRPREEPKIEDATVYLVHDKKDEAAADQLQERLQDRGLIVLRPLFEGSIEEISKIRDDALQIASAIVIHWGNAGEAWLRGQVVEISRARISRPAPLRARAIHIAEPITSRKKLFSYPDFQIVRDLESPEWSQLMETLGAKT